MLWILNFMNTCEYLFFADYLLTQNEGREVIEQAALATRGNRIVAVGTRSELDADWQAEQVVNLGRAVLMPGLSNGHTHLAMSFLRGKADDKPLMDWLNQDIFPIEAKLTSDIVRMAAEFSCAEMIRTGTTSFLDMYPFQDGIFSAVDRMGMRAVLGEGVLIYPTASFKNGDEALDIVRRHGVEWRGHERIRGAVLPHAIYTTSPEFLMQCRDLAEELDWTLGMHLSETVVETQDCLKLRGVRPVEYCRDLGLLSARSTFFHMVDVNETDLDMVASSGSAIVHNPVSNMKLASGVAPIGMMLERGIPVGLGSDGPASNNAQNMFREMLMSALLQKVNLKQATALPAQTVLDMATRGSAAALHWKDMGTLEAGSLADFIALDLTSPNMQPVYNVISNVVYGATGMENKLTVVDGKILYLDGKYTQVDYATLLEQMDDIRRWTLAQC